MLEHILQRPAICTIQHEAFKTFGQTTNRLKNEIKKLWNVLVKRGNFSVKISFVLTCSQQKVHM